MSSCAKTCKELNLLKAIYKYLAVSISSLQAPSVRTPHAVHIPHVCNALHFIQILSAGNCLLFDPALQRSRL